MCWDLIQNFNIRFDIQLLFFYYFTILIIQISYKIY